MEDHEISSSVGSKSLDGSSITSVANSSSEQHDQERIRSMLHHLWAGILGEPMEDIDDQTSFFDMGGNSLLAAELVQQARQKGILLAMETIFEYSTLEDMPAHAAFASDEDTVQNDIPPFSLIPGLSKSHENDRQELCSALAAGSGLSMDQIDDAYPCSPFQEAMIAAAINGRRGYMTQRVYRLDFSLDLAVFKECWERVYMSTEALRTRIIRHQQYGLLQYVVRGDLKWRQEDNLRAYLCNDQDAAMTEASELFRIAIVTENGFANDTARFLVVTMHHAIFDAAAFSHVLRDVLKSYQERPNTKSHRPSFNGFVRSLHEELDLESADRFWAEQTNNIHPSPFPPVPDDMKIDEKCTKVPCASASIKQAVELSWPDNLGVTPALLFRAAWAILLAQHSHNEDVCFAAALSGRASFGGRWQETLGPTVTTVPVCVKFKEDSSVSALLEGIRHQAAGIMQFEQYGLWNVRHRIPESIRACGEIGSFLVVQSSTEDDIDSMLAPIGVTPIDEGLPLLYDFPLVNECIPSATGYEMILRFDPEFLSEAFVRVLAAHFHQILHHLCHGDPKTCLGEIEFFTKVDKLLASEWNKEPHFPSREMVPELFQRQVCVRPLSTAICAWDGSFTYQELDILSSHLSHQLQALGVGSTNMVPICSEKSKWVPVAILATMKAGAAWVPIDPQYPRDRVKEILQAVNALIIVSSLQQASSAAGHGVTVAVPEIACQKYGNNGDADRPTATEAVQKVTAASRAYVFFTSGSTGKPKGVVISHGALSTAVLAHGIAMGCNSRTRCLQFAAHTFDISNSELLMTLCYGGCVCIPSEEQRLNDLPGFIRQFDVNFAILTPSVAHLFTPDELPSLTDLVFSGEPGTAEHVTRWADRVRLSNAYGPTEASIYCSINTGLTPSTHPLAIGHACGGTLWVVSVKSHKDLAPVGLVGELAVSGPIVGEGYLANEEASQAAFVSAPWLQAIQSSASSEKLYLTGDLAFYRPDGSIQLMGRRDHQIKLRGYRIELGEIERRLAQLAPEAQIVVSVPKTGRCEDHIVALLCFSDSVSVVERDIKLSPSEGELLSQLRRRLALQVPPYMVPSHWGVINQLPLSSSGKLDRKAISAWLGGVDENDSRQMMKNHEAARQAKEEDNGESLSEEAQVIFQNIKSACSEILGISQDKIIPNTSFLALNGDSLAAIRLIAHCRKTGVYFTVQDLLASPTLGELCKRIQPLQSRPRSLDKPSLPLSPLISSAQIYWLRHPARGHRGFALRLLADVPQERLHAAFRNLVEMHPMLRARFAHQEQDLGNSRSPDHQRWVPVEGSFRLEFHQHRNLGQPECAEIIQKAHDSINPFDGPVFSVDVYRAADGESCVIYMVSHAAVMDELSWPIIHRQLDQFLTRSRKATFPSPEPGIGDWMREEVTKTQPQDWPTFALNQAQLSFWGLSASDPNSLSQKIADVQRQAHCITLLSQQDVTGLVTAAVLCAFHIAFPDHGSPRVWAQYDRRPNSQDENLVGQFSELSSVYQVLDLDLGQTLSAVATAFGRQDGASKSETVWLQSDESFLPDIVFRCQDTDSPQEIEPLRFLEPIREISPHIPGLFALDIEKSPSTITFRVSFDATMQRQDQIHQWLDKAHSLLVEALSKDSRSMLSSEEDRHLQIEDAYPCSYMQEEILAYQKVDQSLFRVQFAMEISSKSGEAIDLERLHDAWQAVVQRHSILRTVFFTQPEKAPMQVVLQKFRANVVTATQYDHTTPQPPDQPQHQMVFRLLPSGYIRCVLHISHALIDGYSISLLQHDLAHAYSELSHGFTSAAPAYRSYIDHYMDELPLNQQLVHWQSLLKHISPCLLASSCFSSGDPQSPPLHFSILPNIARSAISSLCQAHGITLATVIDVAWALTLQSLTNTRTPVWGHIISGRHALNVPQISEIAGPTLAMMVTHLGISENQEFVQFCRQVQRQRVESLPYTGCSPRQIQSEMINSSESSLTGPLFNTAINVLADEQIRTTTKGPELEINLIDSIDPWNVDILVRVWVDSDDGLHSRLEYKPSKFEAVYMNHVAQLFWSKVQVFFM